MVSIQNATRDLGLRRSLGLGGGAAGGRAGAGGEHRVHAAVHARAARRALLAFMLALGAGAGWKALYPLAVFAAALGISLARFRRRARGTARPPQRHGYRV
jgi:hypothetical protein